MSAQTYNGVPVDELVKPVVADFGNVERIAFRKIKLDLHIVEPDPAWPSYFEQFRSRIVAAMTAPSPDITTTSASSSSPAATPPVTIVAINHVGSTSVPGLAAKAVIDIDLVLSSQTEPADEAFYIPRLEACGFDFLFREPNWYGHRFLVATEPISCNLHVFGPRCPEVERHLIFRNWLRAHDDECALYVQAKKEAAAASTAAGEDANQYTERKGAVLKGILQRAFKALGLELQ